MEKNKAIKKQYSVLTYIFNDYDTLKEPLKPQENVEYVCVTDNKDLKSDNWTIVYDEKLAKMDDIFEKCYQVRFNPFKYCKSNICVRIDGAIEVSDSLDEMVNAFSEGKHNIGLKIHPGRDNIVDEYIAWMSFRNYPKEKVYKCLDYIIDNGVDPREKSLIEENITIQKRCKRTSEINKKCLEVLHEVGKSHGEKIERIDQTLTVFTLLKYFKDEDIFFMSPNITVSKYFNTYSHKNEKGEVIKHNKVNSNIQPCWNNKYINVWNFIE